MGNYVSMSELLDLPIKILEIASQRESCCKLLPVHYCNNYYYKSLNKDLKKFFDDFSSKRDTLRDPDLCYQASTFKYDTLLLSGGKRIINKLEKLGDNNIAIHEELSIIYNHSINLAYKLTYTEAFYFVHNFLKNTTQLAIAKKLGMTNTSSLEHTKKSCLVKVLFEFQSFLVKDV